jgi:hypothetical protein
MTATTNRWSKLYESAIPGRGCADAIFSGLITITPSGKHGHILLLKMANFRRRFDGDSRAFRTARLGQILATPAKTRNAHSEPTADITQLLTAPNALSIVFSSLPARTLQKTRRLRLFYQAGLQPPADCWSSFVRLNQASAFRRIQTKLQTSLYTVYRVDDTSCRFAIAPIQHSERARGLQWLKGYVALGVPGLHITRELRSARLRVDI